MKLHTQVLFLLLTSTLNTVAKASNYEIGVQTDSPSMSPDGRQVVFAADYDDPVAMLHLWVADGARAWPIKTAAWVDEEPAWSPDGRRIVFASTPRSGAATDLWLVSPDGSGLTQLTSKSLDNRQPAWSPDGTRIAFVSGQGGTEDVWVINADGSGRTRVTSLPGNEHHPSFSPDGSQIVFSESPARGGLVATLKIVNIDGSGLHALTDGSYPDWWPSWGPKGIVFVSRRDDTENWKIWMIQPDGSGLQRVDDIITLDPAWTRDGRIVYSAGGFTSAPALTAPAVYDPISRSTRVLSPVGGFLTPIDIRPHQAWNDINPKSQGSVRVAILAHDGFDPTRSVDRNTLRFGRTGNEASLKSCNPAAGEDVNGDGKADLVCRFRISVANFRAGDTTGVLRFLDLDGSPREGRDTIATVTSDNPDDVGD